MIITFRDLNIIKALIPDKNIEKFQFIHKVGPNLIAENRDFIINFNSVNPELLKKCDETTGNHTEIDNISLFSIPVKTFLKARMELKLQKQDKLNSSFLQVTRSEIKQVLSGKCINYINPNKNNGKPDLDIRSCVITDKLSKKSSARSKLSLLNFQRIIEFLNSLNIKKSDLDTFFMAIVEKKVYIKYISKETGQIYKIMEK